MPKKRLEHSNCTVHELRCHTASPQALFDLICQTCNHDQHIVESIIRQLLVGDDNKPMHNLICNLTCPIIYQEVWEVAFASWRVLMVLDLAGDACSYEAYEVIRKVETRNVKWKSRIWKAVMC